MLSKIRLFIAQSSGPKRRVAAGVLAHLYAQAVTILTQLASLPLFMKRWTPAEYGEWLLLSALPVYFTLADGGILTAAGNLMSMSRARDDLAGLVQIFRCSLCVVLVLVPAMSLLLGGGLSVFTFGLTLNERTALAYLLLAAFLTVGCGIFDAAYRPFGKYPLVTVYLTTARVFEWLGTMLGLYMYGTLASAALGFLIGRASACIAIYALAHRDIPELKWKTTGANWQQIRRLLLDGLGFLSFPVGGMLTIQGMVVIVGAVLGPTAVAQFNTNRTLTRVVAQISMLSGRALSPEISALYGAGREDAADRLSTKTLYIVLPLAIAGAFMLTLAGPTIIEHWGKGRIAFDRTSFNWLLAAAVINTYWQIQSIRYTATNRHQHLAIVYMFVSVSGLIIAATMPKSFGIVSPSIATFFVDLSMSAAAFFAVRAIRTAKRH